MSRNKPLPPDRRIVHICMPVDLIEWVDGMRSKTSPVLDRGRAITSLLADARIQGAHITGCTVNVEVDVDRKQLG